MVTWDAVAWGIREILKRLRKRQEEEEEVLIRKAERKGMTREEAESLIYQLRMERVVREIDEEYRKAKAYLENVKDKIEDPTAKKLVELYLEEAEKWDKEEYTVLPEEHNAHKIPIIILAEAIQRGKHRDPMELVKYLTGKTYAFTRKIITEYLQGLETKHLEDLAERKGMDPVEGKNYLYSYINPEAIFYGMRKTLERFRDYIGTYHRDWELWKRIGYFLSPFRMRIPLVERLNPERILTRPGKFDSWHEDMKKEALESWKEFGVGDERLVEEILEKPLEEWEEEVREMAEPPPGAKILAHPDRYPTLTQKILLKALILGELQRDDERGIDRNLYRALRNLLTTPLTTGNWHPLLAEWFESLERGQHKSPLTQLLQKLPINPRLRQEAYRYLRMIEEGRPIKGIPEEERRAFREAMERIKEEIWRNPRRLLPAIDRLLYTTGLGEREALKALIGVIDDLAKIYAGEKTPRQVGIERDATQVIHLIRNLQDRGNYIDPYEVSERMRQIIETHIQDPLLRRAYLTALQHYQETHHKVPRNSEYLRGIIERERELEEKLRQLREGGERLSELEVRRIAMLYRTLMLLTPHPTLEETKRFYARLAQSLKVKVGGEEFLPVHGPIAEDVATSFREIRTAGPEEKEEVVRREIASYEPLLFITPHIEKKVNSILSKPHGKLIPLEEHEEFIRHLERTQVRRPLEA